MDEHAVLMLSMVLSDGIDGDGLKFSMVFLKNDLRQCRFDGIKRLYSLVVLTMLLPVNIGS